MRCACLSSAPCICTSASHIFGCAARRHLFALHRFVETLWLGPCVSQSLQPAAASLQQPLQPLQDSDCTNSGSAAETRLARSISSHTASGSISAHPEPCPQTKAPSFSILRFRFVSEVTCRQNKILHRIARLGTTSPGCPSASVPDKFMAGVFRPHGPHT